MTCPRCAFENPPATAFCGRCGTRLASLCLSCGFANPEGFAFCGKCGTHVSEAPAPTLQGSPPFTSPQSYTPKHLAEKILTSKAALEGERKQVTVLFADLKGSMELLAERRRALRARVVEAIEAASADRLAEHVERLAHHAFRAEVWDKAVGYMHQAGEKAASRSAHREAVACLECRRTLKSAGFRHAEESGVAVAA